MKYELALFESIISGHLSPLKLQAKDQEAYRAMLCEKYNTYTVYSVFELKTHKHKYSIAKKKELSSFHPFLDDEFAPNLFMFGSEVQSIPVQIQKALNLNMASVKSIASVSNGDTITLYVTTEHKTIHMQTAEATYYYYCDLLKMEIERLKLAIKDEVFEMLNFEQVDQFIQKNQRALIALSLEVMTSLQQQNYTDVYKINPDFTAFDILALVYIRLEQLLNFIETNYPRHLDKDLPLPKRTALFEINNTIPKLEFVMNGLSSANLNTELLALISEPLVKLITENHEVPVTYREINYSLCYLDAFYELLKRIDGKLQDFESKAINLVYQVNLNSDTMFMHEIESISTSLQQLEGTEARLNFLHLSLKVANQRICRTDIAFDKSLPQLRSRVASWIDEEIEYIRKSSNLSIQPVNESSPDKKPKLKTNLTVAQLSLFFKIQTEVGIIPANNVGDLFSYLASNFSTSNAQQISYGSIRNKFYNPEQSSVDIVRTKIIEMLNKINTIDPDK